MSDERQIGPLMRGVIPYLNLDDADAAIKFYVKAFGAVQHGETFRTPDGRIGNASLEINGAMLMLASVFPEMGGACAKGGAGYTLQLVVADGDAWWARAVKAGCVEVSPFELQIWGDRYGRLRDPFGLDWAVNEPAPYKY